MEKFKDLDTLKMLQIPRVNLNKKVLKLLEGKEQFIDTDEDLQEKIYSGDVFSEILSENENKLEKEVEEELTFLSYKCEFVNYIQVIAI
jgi:hypothetical protein